MRRVAGRDERGAAIVEFAILLPVLTMLIFGIIQFGIAYNRQQAVHAAAREAARFGSLQGNTVDEIRARVITGLADSSLDPSFTISGPGGSATCSSTTSCTNSSSQPCNGTTGDITVTISLPNTIDIPFVAISTNPLTGKGVFQCE